MARQALCTLSMDLTCQFLCLTRAWARAHLWLHSRPSQAQALSQVLRWYGYFKEAVPESARETYRVRRVVLHYYLVDDTMDVEEPKQLNSGIDQVLQLYRSAPCILHSCGSSTCLGRGLVSSWYAEKAHLTLLQHNHILLNSFAGYLAEETQGIWGLRTSAYS